MRLPALVTVPVAKIDEEGRAGFMKFTFISTVVNLCPTSRSECTDALMAASSNVASAERWWERSDSTATRAPS